MPALKREGPIHALNINSAVSNLVEKGDKMKTTLTVRTTVISLLALMVVACAAAGVWAQQALPSQDVGSLAGKWVGRMTPSNEVLQVQIQPDGSYTSVRGTTTGQGTIKIDGGRLMADGHLVTGPNVAVAGPEKSELTLSSKAGKQVISGTGRDNEGPYSFQLTKQ